MAGDPSTSDALQRQLDELRAAFDDGKITRATFDAATKALTGATYAASTDAGAVAQGPGAQSVAGGALIHGDALADVLVNSVKIVTSKADPTEERAWLAAYLNVVIDDCQTLKLEAIDQGAAQPGRRPLQLDDVYVALDTTLKVTVDDRTLAQYFRRMHEQPAREGFSREAEREREMRRVPALEALAQHRRLVLLGVPGSGKSTLVAYVALNLAQACGGSELALQALGPGWTHGPLLPIRVTLRQFAQTLAAKAQRKEPGTGEDLWAFIRAEFRRAGLAEHTAQLVEKVARLSGALFLLDGLDEASTPELRARVLQAVEAFAKANGEKCRYLITARPYAWRGSVDPEEGVYQLASLDDAQIQAFVTSWYAAMLRLGWLQADDAARKRDRLIAARTRSDLQKIVDNPLLLTLTARLNTNRGQLPEDRADLYDEIIKLMLERWNERIGADKALLEQLDIPALRLSDVRAKFEEIAFDAHRASVGQAGAADIGEDALRRSFRALLEDSADKAERVIEYIEQRAGLLIGLGARDAPGRGEWRFTFPHRTFQEFLAGCYLASQGNLNDLGVELANADAGHWKEVLVFAARQARADRGAALADAMVGSEAFDPARANTATSADFVRAVVAAEQLLEIGLPNLASSKPRDAARKRVASWLCGGLQAFAQVPEPTGRAYIGDLLADLGDPRFDPERLNLPGDDMLGFVRVPADPAYVIGTRKADAARVAEIIGDDVPDDELNDAPTPVGEFYIARYPTTVAQFRAFVEATSHKLRDANALYDRGNRPVRYVTWHEAMAYCDWLNERLQHLEALKGFRVCDLVRGGTWRVTLPSELEWEAAARGGKPGAVFSWGDAPDPKMANCIATAIHRTSVVGCFPPNGYGLYDAIGNVWEWTLNLNEPYPYEADDGRKKQDAAGSRSVRGGSFNYSDRYVRCAYRDAVAPGFKSNYLGFRVAVSPMSL